MTDRQGPHGAGEASAPDAAKEAPPLTSSVLRGTLWSVGMRWSVRLLGLVNIAIIARILTPADFGLVAMAMAVVALTTVLLDFGVAWALLRNKHADREDYDTCWTIRILQSMAIGVIVAAAGPLAADYYNDARVGTLVYFTAAAVFVQGFENIGTIDFRKQLQFDKDFRYNLVIQLATVAVSIGLAFAFRNYYSLVLAQLFRAGFTVGLSYVMSAYRPRFSLSRARSIWGFSQWSLINGIAGFLQSRSGTLILGRFAPPAQIGFYVQATEIADLATTDLIMPLNRVLVPSFAQLADDAERAASAFLKALTATMMVAAPVSVGLALVAPEVVQLWLGTQWIGVVPLMQILAIFATSRSITSISGSMLTVLGFYRFVSITAWCQAVLFVVGAVLAVQKAGVVGVAWVQAGVGILAALSTMFWLVRLSAVRVLPLLGAIWRPLAACGMMILAVTGVAEATATLAPILLLILKVLVGAGIYGAAALLLWWLSGRPDGIERVLLGHAAKRLGLAKA
ncbi:lipopolysaccharide biosynthesis protein [Pedomonas mirosovicensis]|uniref:lipopolysaccharide biosynthesis protein n=1 Tax=Pedomonas mirosovicensis TaxID=2908641 RepID=UPI00216A20A7|nr:lipopolysaccharide biosynthesis protein [Pedomonas mirosovicensis]MCH8685859.1 lipopolysaccharide biosynthesis protein [Pedomonas mirosovicensis]